MYLIRIEIGVFKTFKECARSPCNGNHFSSIPLSVSPLCPARLCSLILTDNNHPVSPMYVCPHSQSILYTTPLIFRGSTLSLL